MEIIMLKHPLYHDLSNEEIAKLKGIAKWQSYMPNDLIINTGNRSRDILCIERGFVSVRITDHQGSHVEVARLKEANLIGEMNFIIPTRRTADVLALSEVEAEILPYDKLCLLLSSEPLLASKVFAALNRQLCAKYNGMLG